MPSYDSIRIACFVFLLPAFIQASQTTTANVSSLTSSPALSLATSKSTIADVSNQSGFFTSSFSSFLSQNTSSSMIAVTGPSYSSKSEPTSHSATTILSQRVSVSASTSQFQSSAPPLATSVSAISTSASEKSYSSASPLESKSQSVSQNISASKCKSINGFVFQSIISNYSAPRVSCAAVKRHSLQSIKFGGENTWGIIK